MLDTRVGRFRSKDKLMRSFPGISPFSYAENSPIMATDKNGQNAEITITKGSRGKDMSVVVKVDYYTTVEQKKIFYSSEADLVFQQGISSDVGATFGCGLFKGAYGKTQYEVSFLVDFKPALSNESALSKMLAKNPGANSYRFSTDKSPSGESSKNATSAGGNVLIYNYAQPKSGFPYTIPHEVGHNLGIGHGTFGIGVYAADRTLTDEDVNQLTRPAVELANRNSCNTCKIILYAGQSSNGKASDIVNTYKLVDDKGKVVDQIEAPVVKLQRSDYTQQNTGTSSGNTSIGSSNATGTSSTTEEKDSKSKTN